MADAAELKALVQASGGPQAATSQRLWSVVGEPAIGRSTGSSFTVTFGFLAGVGGSFNIPVDTTAPTPPVVTDDGAFTTSTTQLHATWTASSDPESGIVNYDYVIRQDSSTGPIIVNETSVGLATQVTRTGLTLISGKSYFIGVRARNGAGLYSTRAYSNGITVQVDTTPPTLNAINLQPGPSPLIGETLTVSVSVTDNDPSPLEYQFLWDGAVVRAWATAATFSRVIAAADVGKHRIQVQVRDAGGQVQKEQNIYVYRRPLEPPE